MSTSTDPLGDWQRTHWNGEPRAEHIGTEIVLMGWVHRRRDHGGVIFVDLRDRTGLTQVVFNPQTAPEAHERAQSLRSEYVIAIRGEVRQRPDGQENPKMATGDVEIWVTELKILARAKTPPFQIDEDQDVGEALKLKYRYLDLRKEDVQRPLLIRHRFYQLVRKHLSDAGFIEVETPVLTRSTPEGARDYLVPSRVNPGQFYALPQSPQLFKQLLMVAGFERYFQIVKCFRDEDLRQDRQPEFSQVDCEMSFVTEEQIFATFEGMVRALFGEIREVDLPDPFPRMTYDDAVARYGTDRPDLRFGMELREITGLVGASEFRAFKDVVERGGIVKVLVVEGKADFTRRELDDLVDEATKYGAKGLAWVRLNPPSDESPSGWQSPIAKFFPDETKAKIVEAVGAKVGDVMLFSADRAPVVHEVLGRMRTSLGERLGLADPDKFAALWVTDFPLFEYEAITGPFHSLHHPFTSPREEDMDKDPHEMYARAYDMVINGAEVGGGSIRIHNKEVQGRIFRALGIGEEEAREKFGFLLDALEYGAPPHGGIAFGVDRLVAQLAGVSAIRDTIAFPKTQRATCPLTDAPGHVSADQLVELGIAVRQPT